MNLARGPAGLSMLLALAGCGGSSTSVRDAATAVDAANDDGGACRGTSLTDPVLDGVSLAVRGPCVFTLAQARAGLSVPFDIVVAHAVPGVVATPQDGGQCERADASGLIPFAELTGGGQRYCLCDTGLCVPPSTTPVTLAAGTTSAQFTWDGVNWTGPSDTNNPKGAAFPAGSYTLRISATGTVNGTAFTIAATYPITLVP
ncbi:MAG: hypothetical protein IT370_18380 [Deltaproteobacteria bacterium]|nr:hypothetical protein [Deltaproteobacteria bacterium]